MSYTRDDLLRLAKRHHNTKRTYLLVDPLQGKHIPVSPKAALSMMDALGEKLHECFPSVNLVIGFAETATAVASAAAARQGADCMLVNTTREADFLDGKTAIHFFEEHSHAVDQNLCLDGITSVVERADTVAVVDDEFSTGKTLVNFIRELRAAFPALAEKKIVACSVISRLSDEQKAAFRKENIFTVSLLELPFSDYTADVARYAIAGAPVPPETEALPEVSFIDCVSPGEARFGVNAAGYKERSEQMAEALFGILRGEKDLRTVTVLGTEEYMYPGLAAGAVLESKMPDLLFRYHATTRSPIGICSSEGYPITCGFRIRSFYSLERETYLYDIMPCDAAVVFTDSGNEPAVLAAVQDLRKIFGPAGCKKIIVARSK